jgi:hypothetical protein
MINCRDDTNSKFATNTGFPFYTARLTVAVGREASGETSLPDIASYANVSQRAVLKAQLISKWKVLREADIIAGNCANL